MGETCHETRELYSVPKKRPLVAHRPKSAMQVFVGDMFGAWLSLVEHLVRDQGVGGSNPLAPTHTADQE